MVPSVITDEDTVRTRTIIQITKCEIAPEMTRRHLMWSVPNERRESNRLTFYKTLFARMGNVKAGKFVDEETGEALNDVEKTLKSVGVSLRDQEGNFRDFQSVLDEVSHAWHQYDNVSKHAVATAMAGTRQQEKFFVLMENYVTATKYAEVATDSLGTSQEKYGEYLDSIEAKMSALTAQFESFSQTLLDSSLVKGVVSDITDLVRGLEKLVEFGDGIVVKIALVVTSIIALYAAIKKIKSLKLIDKAGHFIKSIKMIASNMKELGVTTFITSKQAKGLSDTLKTLGLDPVVLGITVAIAVFASLVKILDYASEAAIRSSEAAIKNAQTAKSTADAIRDEKDALDDLIDSYEQIAKENMDDATSREEALKIQQQIVDLAGNEAKGLDLINGKLDERLEKLRKIRLEEAKDGLESAEASYRSSEKAVEKALYTDLEGVPWMSELFVKTNGESIVARGKAQDAADILSNLDDRIKINLRTGEIIEGFQKYTSMYFDAEDADEYYELLSKSIEALKGANNDNFDDATEELYGKLLSAREYYSGLISAAEDEAKQYLSNLIEVTDGTLNTDLSSIDSLEDFEKFKQSLVDSVSETDDTKKMLENGRITRDDISNAVEKYMMSYYDDLYAEVTKASKSAGSRLVYFNEILEELQPGFDAYSAAMSDMSELGYLQADTLSTLLELFPKLEDDLELTANGYRIAADELDKWIALQREDYVASIANAKTDEETSVARANLERFLTVEATLKMSDAIKKETEALEDQQEVLEKELDAHKKLVDIRKELLETFKEEKDYQDELEKKQRNVARLQTSLTVARLDTSAAGQARVRELEQELKEAQDDLDDFTLEHAIDVLMDQLDKEYEQHERRVNRQVAALDAAKKAITGTYDSLPDAIDALLEQYLEKPKPIGPEAPETPGESDTQNEPNPDLSHITTGPVDKTDENKSAEYAMQEIFGMVPNKKPFWEQLIDDSKDFDNTDFFGRDRGSGISRQDIDIRDVEIDISRPIDTADDTNTSSNYAFEQIMGMPPPVADDSDGLGELFANILLEKWKEIFNPEEHHTGGFVGDAIGLRSNEEFAKLLRGEFVSTPRQMDVFMKKTLPSIASFGSTEKNEFNAPLISIECGNVTRDSLPELQDIVNKAVSKIQRQLNDGMSRSGYKQNINKKQFI